MKITESCTSCGTRLVERGSTSFACPSCGEGTIGRCPQCRDQSVSYSCDLCDFRGP